MLLIQRNRSQSHSQNGPRRCGRCVEAHTPDNCWFATVACRFYNIKGHIESACEKKTRYQHVKIGKTVWGSSTEPVTDQCFPSGHTENFEIDCLKSHFISLDTWHKNKTKQHKTGYKSTTSCKYKCTSKQNLPVLGGIASRHQNQQPRERESS
ncbi:hypothetical protein PoB_000313000 [Plakobranchus ocellatus]|uniref:Uncharacterized protein n=1 Tax=Plakobranchus ocellatus TaxID=259542 RepID=A0AAV3Y0M3_9GAST|nr:hypothetical protein PoB_000313000 [Plakobranchus ocellatus]